MTDLHARLVAAVTARLDTARKATPGPWRKHVAGTGIRGSVPYAFVTDTPADANVINPIVERHNGGTLADVEHIAANDPAFTIRDCERDLRVLARHRPQPTLHNVVLCSCCGRGGVAWWPCAEVRDLAHAYDLDVEPAGVGQS